MESIDTGGGGGCGGGDDVLMVNCQRSGCDEVEGSD